MILSDLERKGQRFPTDRRNYIVYTLALLDLVRLRNDLQCVDGDVKPYSLTHFT